MFIRNSHGSAPQTKVYPKYQAPDSPHHRAFAKLDDSYVPSTGRTIGKAVAGGLAGGLFTSLLASIPVSLVPALGGTPGLAGAIYATTIAVGAISGGVASAAMPGRENWY